MFTSSLHQSCREWIRVSWILRNILIFIFFLVHIQIYISFKDLIAHFKTCSFNIALLYHLRSAKYYNIGTQIFNTFCDFPFLTLSTLQKYLTYLNIPYLNILISQKILRFKRIFQLLLTICGPIVLLSQMRRYFSFFFFAFLDIGFLVIWYAHFSITIILSSFRKLLDNTWGI